MDLPLTSLRVLDLTEGDAQYCGRYLADLGAQVVLVEPDGGSAGRRTRSPSGCATPTSPACRSTWPARPGRLNCCAWPGRRTSSSSRPARRRPSNSGRLIRGWSSSPSPPSAGRGRTGTTPRPGRCWRRWAGCCPVRASRAPGRRRFLPGVPVRGRPGPDLRAVPAAVAGHVRLAGRRAAGRVRRSAVRRDPGAVRRRGPDQPADRRAVRGPGPGGAGGGGRQARHPGRRGPHPGRGAHRPAFR